MRAQRPRRTFARQRGAARWCTGCCNPCRMSPPIIARIGGATFWRAMPPTGQLKIATRLPRVLTLLADPRFAALFAQGSRAEVPLVGTLTRKDGEIVNISGQIDRLIVTDDTVLIADFKALNRVPPSTAERDSPPLSAANGAVPRVAQKALL